MILSSVHVISGFFFIVLLTGWWYFLLKILLTERIKTNKQTIDLTPKAVFIFVNLYLETTVYLAAIKPYPEGNQESIFYYFNVKLDLL